MVSLDKSHLFQCVRALKSVSRGVFVCVCFHIYATWCLSESLSQSARSRQQSLVQMRLCLYHFWFAAEWQRGIGRTLLLLSSSEKCSTAHARRKHLAKATAEWVKLAQHREEILAWFASQSGTKSWLRVRAMPAKRTLIHVVSLSKGGSQVSQLPTFNWTVSVFAYLNSMIRWIIIRVRDSRNWTVSVFACFWIRWFDES